VYLQYFSIYQLAEKLLELWSCGFLFMPLL